VGVHQHHHLHLQRGGHLMDDSRRRAGQHDVLALMELLAEPP
jgi:hypothetical protein